jgi:ParB family chromosome partitioning protein
MLRYTETTFDKLQLDEDNVRRVYRNIGDLAETIHQHGLLQNLVVVELPAGEFLVKGGNRRYKAIDFLIRTERWETTRKIPIAVVSSEDDAVFEQLIENIHREELLPWEAGARFTEIQEGTGATQDEIAARIKKSQNYVSNCIRAHLLIHPNVIKKLEKIGPEFITIAALRKLCTLTTVLDEPDEKKQLAFLEQILRPRRKRAPRSSWKTSELKDTVFNRYVRLKTMGDGRHTETEHRVIRQVIAYLEGTTKKLKLQIGEA